MKTILVTRPEPMASELASAIVESGHNPIVFPVLEIQEINNPNYFSQLEAYDWAIFISPTAVLRTFAQFDPRKWPTKLKIAAIGAGTAAKLEERGCVVNLVPPLFNSESLLEMPAFSELKNTKIILFRGEGGRALLAQTLETRGAEVLHAIVYKRVLPKKPNKAQRLEWQQKGIDAIVITSQEALLNLIFLLDESNQTWLLAQRLIVTSPAIQMLAQQKGFQFIFLAENASTKAIMTVIEDL